MMDILVQLTASHKISAGSHVIQVMNGRSDDFLYYKPSTPIGEKDTTHNVNITRLSEPNDNFAKGYCHVIFSQK